MYVSINTIMTLYTYTLIQPHSFCPSLQIMSEVMKLSQNVAVSLPVPEFAFLIEK